MTRIVNIIITYYLNGRGCLEGKKASKFRVNSGGEQLTGKDEGGGTAHETEEGGSGGGIVSKENGGRHKNVHCCSVEEERMCEGVSRRSSGLRGLLEQNRKLLRKKRKPGSVCGVVVGNNRRGRSAAPLREVRLSFPLTNPEPMRSHS